MLFLKRKSHPNWSRREWFPKTRNDLIEPTNTYLLTFGMPKLPTNIKAGLSRMKIVMFLPNQVHCFKFQRFGHSQNTRRAFKTCFRCSEEGHDGKSCQKDPCVKIVKVITCHPQSNLPAGEKKKKF